MGLLFKQPQALFGLPAPNRDALRAFDTYLGQIAQNLESCNWDKDVVEILDLLPQVFLKLSDHVEVPVDCIKVLNKHMYVVMQSYKQDKNPQLEDMLLLSSEYSYHMLHLFNKNTDYTPCHSVDEYKVALLIDPDWALRWCHEQKDARFYPEVLQYIYKTQEANSRSAFAYHRLKAMSLDRLGQLADIKKRLPLLLRDPKVCLWLLDLYPELDKKVLFRSALGNPDYLLVWAQLYRAEFDALIRRELLRYPAWMADYINMFNPPDARDLWLNAREKCSNDWLLPWVEQFGKAARWY